MHDEIGSQTPNRRSDDHPLRQRNKVVRLPQRRACDRVAQRRQGKQLEHQQQQPRDNREVELHRVSRTPKSPSYA